MAIARTGQPPLVSGDEELRPALGPAVGRHPQAPGARPASPDGEDGDGDCGVSKPGRNDPCPCGSGQKYKKCCQERDESTAAVSSDSRYGATVATQVKTHVLAPASAEMQQLISLFNNGLHGELQVRTRSLIELYPNYGPLWNLFGASLRAQG